MPLGYGDTLTFVRNLLAKGGTAAELWPAVVEHVAGDVDADVVTQLRGLAVAEDVARLRAWLVDTFDKNPAPHTILGLRFALWHPEGTAEPTCDLRLTGTIAFDQGSDTWIHTATWRPKARPRSQVLEALSPISADERYADRPAIVHLGLWYALLAVTELCREAFPTLRKKVPLQGVGIGFEDGDLVNLGVHSKAGFRVLSPEDRGRHKQTLLPGDYFKLEGGPDLLMYVSKNPALPKTLFQTGLHVTPPPTSSTGLPAPLPLPLQKLEAKIDAAWPHQTGTLGSLAPFNVFFLPARVANGLLKAFPDEAQFHELRLTSAPGEWRVLHVLQIVRCYDRETSTQRGQLTLVRSVANNHNLFFVAGYYEGQAVIVSRAAAQLMLDLGVRGATFVPVGVK